MKNSWKHNICRPSIQPVLHIFSPLNIIRRKCKSKGECCKMCRRVTISHYHADNGKFKGKAIEESGQSINFPGVYAHHQYYIHREDDQMPLPLARGLMHWKQHMNQEAIHQLTSMRRLIIRLRSTYSPTRKDTDHEEASINQDTPMREPHIWLDQMKSARHHERLNQTESLS